MPSFADSIFLFVLALLLFGPKKLPVLARELGKWVGEFRRASNEFKMQMEEELRISEQSDRQKQIAAMEAAAPVPPPLEEPEHPHLPHTSSPEPVIAPPGTLDNDAGSTGLALAPETATLDAEMDSAHDFSETADKVGSETMDGVRPIPIATSGELQMMPPATGLPAARSRNGNGNPLGGLLEAIPETPSRRSEPAFAEAAPENGAHGD